MISDTDCGDALCRRIAHYGATGRDSTAHTMHQRKDPHGWNSRISWVAVLGDPGSLPHSVQDGSKKKGHGKQWYHSQTFKTYHPETSWRGQLTIVDSSCFYHRVEHEENSVRYIPLKYWEDTILS